MLKSTNYRRVIKSFSYLNLSRYNNFSSPRTFDIVLPTMNKLSLQFDDMTTVKDLETVIKKNYNYEKIEFRTWDNSTISKNNHLSLMRSESDPIFMRINTSEWQMINAKNFDYTTTENNMIKYDLTHDEKTDLGEISETIRSFNKNPNLTDKEIQDISMNLLKIKHAYSNSDLLPVLDKYKNLEEIFSVYYNLRHEFARLHLEKEKIMWKSETKARILILLGGLFFIVQLMLIYYGTFVKYSWDIVEPMTYLMGCMNIVIVLLHRRKFKNFSALDYYTNKFFLKKVTKKKFDIINYQQTEQKLRELEKILNR